MRRLAALPLLAALSVSTALSATLRHEVAVKLEPATHSLSATDRFTVPAEMVTADFTFTLNADLKVALTTPGLKLVMVKERVRAHDVGIDREDSEGEIQVPVNVYRVEGAAPGKDLVLDLKFDGAINNQIKELNVEYARGFSQSPGLIEDRGVYLAGSTHWIPEVKDALITYKVDVDLPEGWKSVSQGGRTSDTVKGGRHLDGWSVDTPTEEIYLIGARFHEYDRDAGAAKAMAFLRTKDDAMAAKYLEATAQYMEMYRSLLGPYPYAKFALVENFWETGYGMPSFTLLGEQIIRFPFILHSSYPHELLHNWWGNGVFVDFASGNWCEGLTAYMADHLIAEQRGQGSEYRRDTLQRTTDYVNPENDFPLTKFRSRHNGVTEAVGYGKTSMVWNMLREKVGDEAFTRAFQKFYRDNKYRNASFNDIRIAFEAVTKQDLKPYFHQWIEKTGAPELALKAAKAKGNQLTMELAQLQKGQAFALDVPVFVHTSAGVEKHVIVMDGAAKTATLELKAPAERVEVDPQFMLYRRLDYRETPAALSKAFGAEKVTIVVPANGPKRYQDLAKTWARNGVEVKTDAELARLPADRAVWVLGHENKFAKVIEDSLKPYGADISADGIHIGQTQLKAADNSFILSARHPENPTNVAVLLTAHSDAAVAGLARKLPHYGKYSWLAFTGDAPDNSAKGEWPAVGSPLVKDLVKNPKISKLPMRPALATIPAVFDGARMMKDVSWLADPAREGRGVGTKGLEASASYISDSLKAAGLQVTQQSFEMKGPDGKPVTVSNVIGTIPGTNPAYAGQSVVLSAHYDHLGLGWPDVRAGDKGKVHAGADDNASGVAVMLELARNLAAKKPERTVHVAAFTAEESGLVGSKHFVASGAAGKVIGNVNLDTVGRLGDGKVTVFGANSAREWRFIFMGATAVTGVATEVVTGGVNASDNTAFVAAGVPAVQIFASTAQDYHRPSDTAEKIDTAGLVKVATIAREAVDYLSVRPDALNFEAAAATAAAANTPSDKSGAPPAKRASTGMMPDFAYDKGGVLISHVAEGSGAAAAGLKAGDVVTGIAGTKVADLKAYSDALKTLKPGQTVDIAFMRDGKPMTAKITLGER